MVADSAQFSAAVSELTDPRYVGTALTLQTGLGFLLARFTLRLIAPFQATLGWEGVFELLAVGRSSVLPFANRIAPPRYVPRLRDLRLVMLKSQVVTPP